MKIQCPFKTKNYRCQYGKLCSEDVGDKGGMPSEWNECPVAQRQNNGNPWRTERQVEWVEMLGKYVPSSIIQENTEENKP